MAIARIPRIWGTIFLQILVCFCLSGCLEFESIYQPSSVFPDDTVSVSVTAAVLHIARGRPYCGVCLPKGWTIEGDAIFCTGISDQAIHHDNSFFINYDSVLSIEQENLCPSPAGYYWWVGVGSYVDLESESFYCEVRIQTDGQTGRFSIDYMLAYTPSEDDLPDLSNQQISHNHPIEVVDEYSPGQLKAAVEGDMVSLNWNAPFIGEGLIGYNVYRDGQIINAEPVVDSTYIDEVVDDGVRFYAIASLYDNGDVPLLPYEIKVLIFSGGTGEPNDPYCIATPLQLTSFSSSDFPPLLDKCFVLVNDIDLDPNLPGGQIFDRAVIAPDISGIEDDFQGTAFTGKFDGDGYKIRNLNIAGRDYLGLVGAVDDGGQVLSLGVVDANVVGTGSRIGILAGFSSGNITNCYSTGMVGGKEEIGGLVGDNGGQVAFCYSTGSVNGGDDAGGLVGENSGSVAFCYSTGLVSGEENIGGFIGEDGEGDVSHSFWDVETSGHDQSDGGVGLTTAEMMDPGFVGLNSWACDPNWILDSGRDYPHLALEGTTGQSIPEPVIDWLDGAGTMDDPYQIENADQLIMMGKASILWDKHFVLSSNINLIDKIWPMPVIGKFWGTFDGNGFAVSNLSISGRNKLGLFGHLKEGARIIDLGVVDANVIGTGSAVGMLAGYNHGGSVMNCYSTGSVRGNRYVGGLVGMNYDRSIVRDCYSTGMVSGDVSVGGLVGVNHHHVINSYSTGSVSGHEIIGGLVGRNPRGEVVNSYSTGTVSGYVFVGGLVGLNPGTITSCYSTAGVSGNRTVGGFVGDNRGSIATSYSRGSVRGERSVAGFVGENYRYGNVINCYSTGLVRGENEVGGLIGVDDSQVMGEVTFSFWDIRTSRQVKSAGGTGKKTIEMRIAVTFLVAGWDFVNETTNGSEDIWWIDEGQDYPRLWWETE